MSHHWQQICSRTGKNCNASCYHTIQFLLTSRNVPKTFAYKHTAQIIDYGQETTCNCHSRRLVNNGIHLLWRWLVSKRTYQSSKISFSLLFSDRKVPNITLRATAVAPSCYCQASICRPDWKQGKRRQKTTEKWPHTAMTRITPNSLRTNKSIPHKNNTIMTTPADGRNKRQIEREERKRLAAARLEEN